MTDYQIPMKGGEIDWDAVADNVERAGQGMQFRIVKAIHAHGVEQGRLDEREACASECESLSFTFPNAVLASAKAQEKMCKSVAKMCADAIRARGETDA